MTFNVPQASTFDVETKRIGDPYVVEVAALAIIDSSQPYKILFYLDTESTGMAGTIREGVEYLLASKRLVSFNGRKFDIPTLLKYMSRGEGRKLRNMPHYDILYEYEQQNTGRISLKNFAKHSLNLDKFDLVNDTAIGLYQHGPLEKLAAYNYSDTLMTYLLYLHTLEKGELLFKLPTVRRFTPNIIFRT